jgi:alanine dehydrogenase
MPYTNKNFFAHPYEYHSIFKHYWESSDLMINAIYWDQKAPKFFTKEDMKSNNFHIKVIGDITCDIEGSVPATIRATTIADPVMGYNPQTGEETKPYQDNCIDIMAVDNLPNELPRDASAAFGDQLLHSGVIEELLGLREPKAIHKATIAEDGHLNKHYKYLKNFLEG